MPCTSSTRTSSAREYLLGSGWGAGRRVQGFRLAILCVESEAEEKKDKGGEESK
jgi:hypothetical protein